MNTIENTNTNELTMSSLEISKLTGKRHDHVLVDIDKMLNELNIDILTIQDVYKADNNQQYRCYNLPIEMFNKHFPGYLTKKKNTKSDILYMMTDGEFCKIGITSGRDAEKRRVTLQNSNGRLITILTEHKVENARKKELELHNTYKEVRLFGEWFNLNQDQITDVIDYITNA